MRFPALELADRALAFARGGRVLASRPSVVFDVAPDAEAGGDAWRAQRIRPTATSTRHLEAVLRRGELAGPALTLLAMELRRRLAEQSFARGERLWIAAPACAEPRGLGAVLAICRELGIEIEGLVDAATAAVAALAVERSAIVLELGLHHAAATLVERAGGELRRRRAVCSEASGLIELYDAWLALIAGTMVNRTRFDPLREATLEQQLFDQVEQLAQAAVATGSTPARLATTSEPLEVELSGDQFLHAARPVLLRLTQLVQGLRGGGATHLVVSQPVAALPGLTAALEESGELELIVVPEGFAAAVASSLDLPSRSAQAPVRLLRRLQPQPAPLIEGVSRRSLRARAPAPAPSHLLYEGRTIGLEDEPLVVGRAPQAARALTLPEGLAGVSRRHCTLVREGGELLLIDHSRYGTFLNGGRVAERTRLQAGDRIRLGDPGVELALIAVAG